MADAHKCDRCGTYFETPFKIPMKLSKKEIRIPVLSVSIKDLDLYDRIDWELCPDCMKRIYEFLKGENK